MFFLYMNQIPPKNMEQIFENLNQKLGPTSDTLVCSIHRLIVKFINKYIV